MAIRFCKGVEDELQQKEDEVFADSSFAEQTAPAPEEPVTDMDQLKKSVINELSFSEKDAILATTLMQSDRWTISGNVITTAVASSFTQGQIAREIRHINEVISKWYGSDVQLNVIIKQAKPQNRVEDAPEEIQLLCSIFRGTLISKGERLDSAAAAVAQKTENNEDKDNTEETASANNDDPEVSEEDE